MLFSRRKGYKKVRDLIQIESLDVSSKNLLWTLLYEEILRKYNYIDPTGYSGRAVSGSNLEPFLKALWIDVLEKPTDTIPPDIQDAYKIVREKFFNSQWYVIFDIFEIAFLRGSKIIRPDDFQKKVNYAFEKENIGYRMINGKISQITDPEELNSIDQAIASSKGPVYEHLTNALSLLTDRKNPDFRNSIKESISSIEALVKLKLENEAGTLGALLKHFDFHPALKKGLSSIYGYTSDADGIRHSLLEEERLTYEDAKFFLVLCTAFINLINAKS